MNKVVRIEPDRSSIETPHGPLELVEIALGGTPRGMVLLLCEQGGLEREAVDVVNMLAQHGYESLATEIVTGASEESQETEDPLRGGGVAQHLKAVIGLALERGWEAEQMGMVGIGLGGRAVLAAASSLHLGAAVSFSPTVNHTVSDGPDNLLNGAPPAIRTPWLGLFGDRDAAAPPEDVRTLARSLDDHSDEYTQVVRYANVGREFYHRSGDGVSYAASHDGWQRAMEWLDARVTPMLTPLAKEWLGRQDAQP